MKKETYVKPTVTTEKLEPEALNNWGSPAGAFGGGGGGFRGQHRWCAWGWGWWN